MLDSDIKREVRGAGRFFTGLAALGLVMAANPADAQDAVDLSAFEGYETWPMLMPDDLDLERADLTDLRIYYDAQFPGAGGLDGPLIDTTMVLDVSGSHFRGQPALVIQWSSTGEAGDTASSGAIDRLVVDRQTHRLLHRIQAQPPAGGAVRWGGSYRITAFEADRITDTIVGEDGNARPTELLDVSPDTIDFATLQFFLPFIDLEEGLSFRVPVYRYPLNELNGLPVHVVGREEITDGNGAVHEVWAIDVMSIGGGALTRFWIDEDAPYFLGWDYRLARTGRRITRMDYRSHWQFPESRE